MNNNTVRTPETNTTRLYQQGD